MVSSTIPGGNHDGRPRDPEQYPAENERGDDTKETAKQEAEEQSPAEECGQFRCRCRPRAGHYCKRGNVGLALGRSMSTVSPTWPDESAERDSEARHLPNWSPMGIRLHRVLWLRHGCRSGPRPSGSHSQPPAPSERIGSPPLDGQHARSVFGETSCLQPDRLPSSMATAGSSYGLLTPGGLLMLQVHVRQRQIPRLHPVNLGPLVLDHHDRVTQPVGHRLRWTRLTLPARPFPDQ